MVFLGWEEVAHHFDRDLIAGFQVGVEVFVDFDAIEQVGVINSRPILVANVVSLLIDGVGVDEAEVVVHEVRDRNNIGVIGNLDRFGVVGLAGF